MNSEREFWTNLRKDGTCWIWQGAVDSRGYGHLRWFRKVMRAHRLAYELSKGAIPTGGGYHGTVVMHSCDNRLCCNPGHLRAGSHADNMSDMKTKGRRLAKGAGTANGRAKLTPEQVQAIRADGRGKRTIAPEYGISPAQVQRIRKGVQWK